MRRRFIECVSTCVLLVVGSISVAACHGYGDTHDNVTVGSLSISHPYLVAPAGDAPAAMYFTVRNRGSVPDTLVDIHVAGVTDAELHMEVMSRMPHAAGAGASSMDGMNMATMVKTPVVPIQAHSTLRLAPGGRHVMLMGMQRRFTAGDTTSATLTFTHTGAVRVPVRVIGYAQLDSLVGSRASVPRG